MKTKTIRLAFKRGDDVHLDTIYDVQAFCIEFMKPIDKYKSFGWTEDTSDTFKCKKGFSIEIKVRTA